MDKKKIDTKALLEQARNAKIKNLNKNFDKIVGKKRSSDETKRVNFNKGSLI